MYIHGLYKVLYKRARAHITYRQVIRFFHYGLPAVITFSYARTMALFDLKYWQSHRCTIFHSKRILRSLIFSEYELHFLPAHDFFLKHILFFFLLLFGVSVYSDQRDDLVYSEMTIAWIVLEWKYNCVDIAARHECVSARAMLEMTFIVSVINYSCE